MKVSKLYLAALFVCLACLLPACHEGQDPYDPEGIANKGNPAHITDAITSYIGQFQVTLLDGYPRQVGDNWEWVWRITNTQYHQGAHSMDYFNMSLGNCATINNVVGMYYGRFGTDWVQLSIPPYQEDPNTPECNEQIGNTLKFDRGTYQDCPTYLKLVVNEEFPVSTSVPAMPVYGEDCSVGTIAGLGDCNVPDCFSDPVLVYAGNRSFQLTSFLYTRYVTNGLGTATNFDLRDAAGNVIGTVSISDNTTTVTVTYTVNEGWYLTDTYLDVACSNSGLHAYGGYPVFSQFDYHNVLNNVQTYTYTFDNPMCNCNSVYLMTYAYAVQEVPCDGDGG